MKTRTENKETDKEITIEGNLELTEDFKTTKNLVPADTQITQEIEKILENYEPQYTPHINSNNIHNWGWLSKKDIRELIKLSFQLGKSQSQNHSQQEKPDVEEQGIKTLVPADTQITQALTLQKQKFDDLQKQFEHLYNLKEEQKQKFLKIIDGMLAKGLNGKRYNFMIDGEQLKSTLEKI